jgi:hypothetical protein
VVDGRVRRYHRLTDEGAQALAEQAARLRRNADAATGQLRRRTLPLGPATVQPG